MQPEQVQDLLRQRPFRPLQVELKDGSTYDLLFPNLAMVTRHELVIGFAEPGSAGDVANDAVFLGWSAIARIEPKVLNGTAA